MNTTTTTDLEHAFGARRRSGLQNASFHNGLHHAFVVTERQAQIGKRQIAAGRRHEVLAAHRGQRFEHAAVQHVPGTHLLLDHVVPCEFDIQ